MSFHVYITRHLTLDAEKRRMAFAKIKQST
jgi:hypothetical protein